MKQLLSNSKRFFLDLKRFLLNRNKFWFYFLSILLSIIVIGIGAFLYHDFDTLSTILISIASSYFAAICYDLINTFFEFRNLIDRKSKFSKFLGYSNGKKRVAIILPKHKFLEKVFKQIKDKGVDPEKFEIQSIDEGYAISDVKAASDVYTVFKELEFETPSIRSYNDFLDNKLDVDSFIKSTKWGEHDVIISIGLYSSELLREIQLSNKGNLSNDQVFQLDPPPLTSQTEKKILIKLSLDSTTPKREPASPQNKGDEEFGLIAKIKYDKKIIIVIGGMTENGTVAMGYVFRNSWEQIFESIFKKYKNLDDIPPFAITYQINYQIAEDGKLIYPKNYIKSFAGPTEIFNETNHGTQR